MGAWIETNKKEYNLIGDKSLPSWERGLKQERQVIDLYVQEVAPFVGAWIETFSCTSLPFFIIVAPFVGAWIETPFVLLVCLCCHRRSLRGSVD